VNKFDTEYCSERPSATVRTASPAADHWAVRGALAFAFLSAAILLMATPADARWYKWVDESGNISYQDRPPPSNYDNSTQVLNQQGITVKRIPSAEERRIEQQRQAEEDARRQHDEMLIKSFPLEEDLTRTRDKRLGHIDGTVARMHDQLVILNSRLASIEDKVDDRSERGLKPSPALDSDRIAVLRSIDSTNALIKSKLKERRQVANKFTHDLARYRKLVENSAEQTADSTYSEN